MQQISYCSCNLSIFHEKQHKSNTILVICWSVSKLDYTEKYFLEDAVILNVHVDLENKSILKYIFKKILLYLYLPKYKNRFLYFGSVCIVKSWFVLVQARRRWIGGPKWSRQSIANRLVEISVRSNFFLGFGRDRNQYLELQNLTEWSSAVIRKWMKLLFSLKSEQYNSNWILMGQYFRVEIFRREQSGWCQLDNILPFILFIDFCCYAVHDHDIRHDISQDRHIWF